MEMGTTNIKSQWKNRQSNYEYENECNEIEE